MGSQKTNVRIAARRLLEPSDRTVGALTVVVWVTFFVALALYQLPQTRISAGFVRFPYFVVPTFVAVLLTLRDASWDEFGRFRLEFGLLAVLVLATLLTGAVNGQAWAEAGKRIGYLVLGLMVVVAVYHRPAILRPALLAFIFVSAAMAIFGFYLLIIGYGEAADLLYWGLHYTPATRNGDSYFMVLPFFFGLYLTTQPGSRWLRLIAGIATAVLWLALLYSFSRGTWIAVGIGLLVLVAGQRNLKTTVAIAVAIVVSAAILTIPIRNHQPLLEFAVRAQSVVVPSETSSNRERLVLIGAGLRIIASHPVAGVGVGGLDRIPFNGESHNIVGTLEATYLDAWAEYGLLGLLVAPGMVLLPLLRLLLQPKPVPWILVAGAVAFAANSGTVSALSSAWFWILSMTLVAFMAGRREWTWKLSTAASRRWQAGRV
jgi:O-antigen ligase